MSKLSRALWIASAVCYLLSAYFGYRMRDRFMTWSNGLMAAALLALSLCGCGVEVTGLHDVKVIHEVNVDGLLPYVTAYCKATAGAQLGEDLPNYPNAVSDCVQVEIGKLITKAVN